MKQLRSNSTCHAFAFVTGVFGRNYRLYEQSACESTGLQPGTAELWRSLGSCPVVVHPCIFVFPPHRLLSPPQALNYSTSLWRYSMPRTVAFPTPDGFGFYFAPPLPPRSFPTCLTAMFVVEGGCVLSPSLPSRTHAFRILHLQSSSVSAKSL